jgi:hypothetical protein
MYDEATLLQLFNERDVPVSGRIAADIYNASHFYVFVEVSRDRDNHQIPTNKALNDLKELLLNQQVVVEFILTDASGQDIEAGFRASMIHSFGAYVRNAFLTIMGGEANAWISPKVSISEETLEQMEHKSRIFLDNYDLKLGRLEFTSTANLPSKFVFLQVLRSISPADPSAINLALRAKHFTVPSDNWTSRMLDNLRKGGFIVRLKSGCYALSLAGLKALGTAKNRRSPDITRMLALARTEDYKS